MSWSYVCGPWGRTLVARFLVHDYTCRLTLQLRLRRQKHKAKARFQSCMPRWLVDIWRWMLASRDTDRAQTTIADAWLPEPKKLS